MVPLYHEMYIIGCSPFKLEPVHICASSFIDATVEYIQSHFYFAMHSANCRTFITLVSLDAGSESEGRCFDVKKNPKASSFRLGNGSQWIASNHRDIRGERGIEIVRQVVGDLPSFRDVLIVVITTLFMKENIASLPMPYGLPTSYYVA